MSAVAAGRTGWGSASRLVVSALWPRPVRLSQTQPTFRGNSKPKPFGHWYSSTLKEILMSTQTLLCVSKNDDHAASALKQIIPSMERGFNINVVHGELAIGGEDAKAITRLLTKLLSDRLAKNQSKSVETQARPDLKKSLVALKSLLAFAIRDWPKYLGTGQAVLQFNGHCFWYSSLEGATIGVTLPVSLFTI
jgi:hypothetical protein